MNYKEYFKNKLLEDVTIPLIRPWNDDPTYNPVGSPIGVVGPTIQNGPRRPGVGTPGGNANTGNPGGPVGPKPFPQNPITVSTLDINLDHLINRDNYFPDPYSPVGGGRPRPPQGGGAGGGNSSQGGGSQGNNGGYSTNDKGRVIYTRPPGSNPMDLRIKPNRIIPDMMRP